LIDEAKRRGRDAGIMKAKRTAKGMYILVVRE
jgi:hypothetical protein